MFKIRVTEQAGSRVIVVDANLLRSINEAKTRSIKKTELLSLAKGLKWS